jgi:hypothetical protein
MCFPGNFRLNVQSSRGTIVRENTVGKLGLYRIRLDLASRLVIQIQNSNYILVEVEVRNNLLMLS